METHYEESQTNLQNEVIIHQAFNLPSPNFTLQHNFPIIIQEMADNESHLK